MKSFIHSLKDFNALTLLGKKKPSQMGSSRGAVRPSSEISGPCARFARARTIPAPRKCSGLLPSIFPHFFVVFLFFFYIANPNQLKFSNMARTKQPVVPSTALSNLLTVPAKFKLDAESCAGSPFSGLRVSFRLLGGDSSALRIPTAIYSDFLRAASALRQITPSACVIELGFDFPELPTAAPSDLDV